MDNDWPAYNVLTLDGSHWIWKFHPDHSNPDLIHMLLESPQPSYHEIVLPVDCVPKLACFDLEYWDTTMINVDPNDPVQALRTRMSQKYFHNVRTRISNTLSKGKHDAPLRHSLLVDIAHKWSIRTIKRFTHSPWGWESYEKHCEREGLVPYQQVLKHEGEYSSLLKFGNKSSVSFQIGRNTFSRMPQGTPQQKIEATWYT